MNSEDIRYSLRNNLGAKVDFLGSFPRENIENFKIPPIRKKPICKIYNTLTSYSRRKLGHWVTICISASPQKIIYYLDSSGLSPEVYGESFSIFFRKNPSYEVKYFTNQIQPLNSRLCALYNIYLVREFSLNGIRKTLFKMRKTFSLNSLKKNDIHVMKYYLRNLNRRSCQYLKKYSELII